MHEDIISKAKTSLTESSIQRQVKLESSDLFISPKSSLLLDYTLYLSNNPGNYFDFINRIRNEKNIKSVIQGSFNFFNIIQNKTLLDDEDQLTEYIRSLGLIMTILIQKKKLLSLEKGI